MAGTMYFGTRGFMQLIPAEAINGDHSSFGYGTKTQYLNGGAGVRRSRSSHKEYVLSWNLASRDSLRPITDFAEGVYDVDDDPNLIYFLDPMALDKNVLPQLWATPGQALADGVGLVPDQPLVSAQTPANSLGYPARSIVYKANAPAAKLWIPIPPGHVAWLGVHGTASAGAGVTVATTLGRATSAPSLVTVLPVTTATRVNHAYAASSAVDGIELSLANLGAASTATATLSGLMVQILPANRVPATGGFISGQGHSGCEFEGHPSVTPHSVGLDKVAMSAKLVEVGSWL